MKTARKQQRRHRNQSEPLLCVSVMQPSRHSLTKAIRGADAIELRLDRGDVGCHIFEALHRAGKPFVVACHAGHLTPAARSRVLAHALAHGASAIDIDLKLPALYRRRLVMAARQRKVDFIASYHDYSATPPLRQLERIIKNARRLSPTFIKIACHVANQADAARLLGIMEQSRGDLIVVGMGEKGRLVRAVAPILGSRIAYVTAAQLPPTAPGQMRSKEMQRVLRFLRQFL